MKELKEKAEAQNASVLEASESFGNIKEEIYSIIEKINNIDATVEVVNGFKNKIVSSIENISAISEEASASAEEINASMEQQTSAMNEVANSSTELSHLAKDLDDEINKFKA
jgi:methyl-accepting chemotaxis protein